MPLDAVSFTARIASEVLETILIHLRPYHWYAFDAALAGAAIWTLLRWLRASRQQIRTTQLQGPPSESYLYGVGKRIRNTKDSGSLYEAWAQEYGPVYAVPSTLGNQRIVLCDPRAVAHFYAKETWTYIQTPLTKKTFANVYGKGLLWAEGEDHKRQRMALAPAFTMAAIGQLTPTFYNSAFKAKAAWDSLIESSSADGAIIEVESWMNHISLDIIGLACFSHHFGALEGKPSPITEILDTFSASPGSTALNKGLLLLAQAFPFLIQVPTPRERLIQRLHTAMEEISNDLLSLTQKELKIGAVGTKEGRSIVEVLIKAASGDSKFRLTRDEVIAQMKLMLLAGYETTSITLTWALLELSRNPDVQTKLRNELVLHGADPTFDQLTNGLPYLDAVVHEVLRTHPPVVEATRMANENDIIPLSEPVFTKSGILVDNIAIAKGTHVAVSIECMNRSTAVWGHDAKLFRPSRWLKDAQGLDGIPSKAKEVHGHRHLLTFVDGPRMCLGRNFVMTDLKTVLAVLVKNFVFEMRDGIDSKIDIGRGVLARPKLAGEVGCKLPLRVRRYAACERIKKGTRDPEFF